jgi:hypothetical protein
VADNTVNSAEVSPLAANDMAAENAAFETHVETDGTEAEHIERALGASETAMQAIDTVTNLATYTLTILGIIIGLVAIVGGVAIWRTAKATAKQIANERFDTYIETDEFKELVKVRIERSINERWQQNAGARLAEEQRDPADPQPFDPPPPAQPPPVEELK